MSGLTTLHDASDGGDGPLAHRGSNRACWREDGILHLWLGNESHRAGALYEERDGQDALDLVTELIGDKEHVRILTDIRGIQRTTAEVRRLPSHRATSHLALLVSGPVSRMLGNAYMGIVKPTHPTRLFSDEANALRWLNAQGNIIASQVS